MASLNRDQYMVIWKHAKHIHTQSRLPDVRRAARAIAAMVEECIGQVEDRPASYWKD